MSDETESGIEQPPGLIATIGPSIEVRGDVVGAEELRVEGRVEGSITLTENRLVVGSEGRIAANIHARTVEVFGVVEGDVRGEEQVIVRASGSVSGNIAAPRVSIEDGARFRGSVEMEVRALPDGARKGGVKPVLMAAAEKFSAEKF